MEISIVDRSGEMTNETHEFAERRICFALSRFSSKIRRITLVLEDLNGPRGGVDKSCRITVELRRMSDVVLTARDNEVRPCVARAAERVGRAVARAMERDRQFDRRRPFVA
jgi:hypothetical protein